MLHVCHSANLFIITFALNVIGHSGYEFFPRDYSKSPLTRLNSSATFHYLHHKNGNTNFGLFLCVWDRMMGTMHPEYDAYFEKNAQHNPLRMPMKWSQAWRPSAWINRKETSQSAK